MTVEVSAAHDEEEELVNLLRTGQIKGNGERKIKYNILDEQTKMEIGIWFIKNNYIIYLELKVKGNIGDLGSPPS